MRILVTLALTATVAAAQTVTTQEPPSPFGLKMGMTRENIESKTEVSRYKFQLASVSRPHADLQTYVVTVTPKAGLCFIRALTPAIETKSDGTQLKAKFDDLKSQLEGIYGMPFITDSLQPDSTRTQPKDWMSALLEKERTLTARWSATEDKLPMKPTILKVYVGTFALSPTSGHIAVEYYFTNYDECMTEVNAPPL